MSADASFQRKASAQLNQPAADAKRRAAAIRLLDAEGYTVTPPSGCTCGWQTRTMDVRGLQGRKPWQKGGPQTETLVKRRWYDSCPLHGLFTKAHAATG